MRSDLQNIGESYSRNILKENVDRLEFLKNKYLQVFYGKLLHIWPEESNLPSNYEDFKKGTETNPKYKSYLEFLSETIDNLISADPFSKVDMEKGAGYAGQYSEWILKTFLKKFDEKGEGAGKTLTHVKRFLNEDLYKINSDLKIYDKNKSKVSLNKKNVRDINQIPDFQTLYYIIKQFIPKYEEELVKDKTKVRILLDNSQYFVGVPLSLSSSQSLGNNTRWCTAARSENNTYFQSYTKDGPLYVVFLKTKNGPVKFQFHFPSGQYMNSDDRPIDVFNFFSMHPIVGKVIVDDYKQTDLSEENLLKAELLTGGLGILEKEPDQFLQNISVRNIVTMITQGQLDMGKLNRALHLLSEKSDNQAEFDEDGLRVTMGKTEYDEFLSNILDNSYYGNIGSTIATFVQNPLLAFFDENVEEEMIPFVLNNVLSPQQVNNVRRVYSDIGEDLETNDEFYGLVKGILQKHMSKLVKDYQKKSILEIFKQRGIAFDKKGRKTSLMIPYDTLLDVFDDDNKTNFFEVLENPSYHVNLSNLLPEINEDQIKDEKENFIEYIAQNLDKPKIVQEILQKVDKK